jgi:hypothetical protein
MLLSLFLFPTERKPKNHVFSLISLGVAGGSRRYFAAEQLPAHTRDGDSDRAEATQHLHTRGEGGF